MVIGSRTFIPGFEDQLIGIAAGETRTVNVTFPENYPAEPLKGKTARVRGDGEDGRGAGHRDGGRRVRQVARAWSRSPSSRRR